MGPCVVSAVKLGASSLILRDIVVSSWFAGAGNACGKQHPLAACGTIIAYARASCATSQKPQQQAASRVIAGIPSVFDITALTLSSRSFFENGRNNVAQ